MANLPFNTYTLPGVYGPTGTDIIKYKDIYKIGWRGNWGKNPMFEGTVKEIARDIILKYSNNLKQYPDVKLDMNSIGYYASIYVQWRPELVCTFSDGVHVAGFIGPEFLDELAKELHPLSKLLPFA